MTERDWNLLTDTPSNWDWAHDLDMNWCVRKENAGMDLEIVISSKLWPVEVINELQKVMEEGEAAGKRGWRRHSADYHINRAIIHLARYGADNDEDHLAHAFTRLMMATAIERGYVNDANGENVRV